MIRTVANPPELITIWSGDSIKTDIEYNMIFTGKDYSGYAEEIHKKLRDKGIIFNGQ